MSATTVRSIIAQGINMPFSEDFLVRSAAISPPEDEEKIIEQFQNPFAVNIIKHWCGDSVHVVERRLLVRILRDEYKEEYSTLLRDLSDIVPEYGRMADLIEFCPQFVLGRPSSFRYYDENISTRNKSIIDEVDSVIHQNTKRFIFVAIGLKDYSLGKHANFILIDTHLKNVHYFEPHVENSWTQDVFDEIKQIFAGLAGYKFHALHKWNIQLGSIQGNDEFCQSWILLFGVVYVLNADNLRLAIEIVTTANTADLMTLFHIYMYNEIPHLLDQWDLSNKAAILEEINAAKSLISRNLINSENLPIDEENCRSAYQTMLKHASSVQIPDTDLENVRAYFEVITRQAQNISFYLLRGKIADVFVTIRCIYNLAPRRFATVLSSSLIEEMAAFLDFMEASDE